MVRKKKDICLKLIWIVLICLILYSGYYLLGLIKEDQQGEDTYQKIKASKKSEFTMKESETKDDNPEQETREIEMWLQCEGTVIDYPVVQGTDNQFYLDHLPDGTPNGRGSIFIDYMNSPNLQDENTVLYGHHMNNETMFGSLANYKSQSYFEQYPTMFLYTREQDYRIDLFAGYVGEGTTSLPLVFPMEEAYGEFVQTVRGKSTFESTVQIQPGDRMISMVTCDYSFDDARFLLFGKLTPL